MEQLVPTELDTEAVFSKITTGNCVVVTAYSYTLILNS